MTKTYRVRKGTTGNSYNVISLFFSRKSARQKEREYKCTVSKMHLKLKDQQFKTSMYVYRLLYKNLVVTAKQKSIIGVHKTRKKISTHNIKDSHQIIREQKKGGEKRPTETNPKHLINWQ